MWGDLSGISCSPVLLLMLNSGSGRSRAVTQGPLCLALKGSAKQPSQLPFLHVTPGIYHATWGWKEIFSIKPQQICSLGAVCVQLGACKGQCKPCAVVGDPSGTADVPHLAARLKYGTLTFLGLVVSSVCILLKCTSVAVNRIEKLSATMRESEYYVLLLQQCSRDISSSCGSINSSTIKNCTLLCSFESITFAEHVVQTPRKMSNKPK